MVNRGGGDGAGAAGGDASGRCCADGWCATGCSRRRRRAAAGRRRSNGRWPGWCEWAGRWRRYGRTRCRDGRTRVPRARRRRSARWIRRPGRGMMIQLSEEDGKKFREAMQKALAGKSYAGSVEPEERAKVIARSREGCPCRSEADASIRRRGWRRSRRNGRRHHGWTVSRSSRRRISRTPSCRPPWKIGIAIGRAPSAGFARGRRNHPREDPQRDQHPEPGSL